MSKIMCDRIQRKYHRSIICNSSKVERTQMPINRRMNKCMCCIQPMMQNNENKRTVYMNNKWTEFQKLNVELKEFKKYILYTDSIHIWPECVCNLCLSRIRQINGTFGNVVNRRKSDGVSGVMVKLHILMCVAWVMYYVEMHQAILIT